MSTQQHPHKCLELQFHVFDFNKGSARCRKLSSLSRLRLALSEQTYTYLGVGGLRAIRAHLRFVLVEEPAVRQCHRNPYGYL